MWLFLLPAAAALECVELTRMVQVGVPESIIVQTIVDTGVTFTPADLACLKAGGASDAVITAAAMNQEPPPTPEGPPCPAPTPAPLPAVLASRAHTCAPRELRVVAASCALDGCSVWTSATSAGLCVDLLDAVVGPVVAVHGAASCRAVAWTR